MQAIILAEINVVAVTIWTILGAGILIMLGFATVQYILNRKQLGLAQNLLASGKLAEALEIFKKVARQAFPITLNKTFEKALEGIDKVYKRANMSYDLVALMKLREDVLAVCRDPKYTQKMSGYFTPEGERIKLNIVQEAQKAIDELPSV